MSPRKDKSFLAGLRRRKTIALPRQQRRKNLDGTPAPNWTERAFARQHLALARAVIYDPPSLIITRTKERRYTADYLFRRSDGKNCYIEVKGTYKLGSEDRARLAWEIAAEKNKSAVFVWAVMQKNKSFKLEIWEQGGKSITHPDTLPI